ncbi:hypothetical protein BHE74_00049951 [Ensete ventricosum]|nr:hypothetical protein GW17_00028069 [Ensete ventricosum]RWW44282.1 hypothetical protein BHE74_00049951 [Ensete ventricosum]RZS22159.1 hypothetical protein BHM03_00054901 [Ensete ventricosum]
MRDLAGCLANQAVRVAEATCPVTGHSSMAEQSPVQNTITCFYRTTLSTRRELLTSVTWSKNPAGAFISVMVEDSSSGTLIKPNAVNSQLLRKKKGRRSFAAGNSAVSLYWDVSAATYESGPEPTRGFYVVMIAEAEFGLLLGDMCGEFVKKLEKPPPIAKFSMTSKREQVRGTTLYSTRAQLGDGGKEHEITIRCKGDELDAEGSELFISVDKKKLVSVKTPTWNFRGNQTVFVDGSAVDVMWDVHDWWFCEASHCARFMFRRKSTSEIRLWSDEEPAPNMSGFSLMIQAFKSR